MYEWTSVQSTVVLSLPLSHSPTLETFYVSLQQLMKIYIRTDWNLPGIDCVWTPVIALSLNHSYPLTSTTISRFLLNATRFLRIMIHSQEHCNIHCSRNSLEHLFRVMTANTQVFKRTPHDNFTTSTHACSLYTTTTTLLSVLSILTCLELAITWPAAAFNLTTQAATTDLHLHMYTTFKPHPLHTPHMLTHHILVHLSGCSWVCPQNGTLLAARS